MIAPSLGRLARSTWQTSTAVIETGQTAASRAVAVTGGHRPISGHQRRHSSSKTPSQPPAGDGVKVVGGRAQQRAQQGDEEGEAGTREYESPLRAIGRRRRRQHEASLPTPSERFSNLPSVPPTSHLDARDVGVAWFFSQHRPISITSSLPPPTSSRAFASIFDPSKHAHSPDTIESTRQKMRQILLSFRTHEASSKAHLSSSNGPDPSDSIHLDGLPPTPQNLDRVLQGASFRPPPPPSPGMPGFGISPAAEPTTETIPGTHDIFGVHRQRYHAQDTHQTRNGTVRRSFKQKIQRKSWSTTIIVTETTDTLGGKSYATTNSPIVQIPSSAAARPSASINIVPRGPSSAQQDPYVEQPPPAGVEVRWRQPFLQRMWLRQRAFAERAMEEDVDAEEEEAGGMLLISVKRQRKLKMKKHKHKKLLKKTRNLRRRLGRD